MVDTSELLRCRGCDSPLAKRHGSDIRVRKNQNGQSKEVSVEVQHSGAGVVSIGCPTCIGITPHYFVTLVAK